MPTKKQSKPTEASAVTSDEPVAQKTALPRKYVAPLIVLLILGLLYAGRSLFIAATVNGQPIMRLSVIRELEKQAGKQALETMVTKTLIQQEAQKKKITVTDKDVTDEIKNIEKNLKSQGQTLDAALAMQGMSKSDLEGQIKIQKMIEKMIEKDIKVTDAEVTKYMETNSAILGETDPKEASKSARASLTQQKKSQKMQEYITQLQKNAKINYFVSY